jgi:hypothetical protein
MAVTMNVWYEWNVDSATATATTGDIWTTWTYASDSTTTTAADNTWYVWNTETATSHVSREQTVAYQYHGHNSYVERRPAPVKSTEQLRAERVQREINIIWLEHRRDLIEAEKAEAEVRAVDLLEDIIGPEQAEIYRKTGRLVVQGEKYDWLLHKDGGVKRISKGKGDRYCVHLKENFAFPDTDNVIALALHAKYNEREFIKTANRGSSITDVRIEGKLIKLSEIKRRDKVAKCLQAASF